MKLFKCLNCGQLLFFENDHCDRCSRRVGYEPETSQLVSMEPDGTGWSAASLPSPQYRFCDNAERNACNWLIDATSSDRFCLACRHNRTIPDLTARSNVQRWTLMERAKHHLFYTILRLGLPLATRAEDPKHGLAFDFLEEKGAKVLTGHDDGLITLNLAEADPAARERLRQQMGEPYRTLLGHFRHEIGHYFWDRLVRDGDQLESCRAVFGDERQDYAEALKVHYANGAPPDWQEHFISAYATSHPWEDFAETWAHYFHIIDTLEMGGAFRLHIHPSIVAEGSIVDADLGFDPHEDCGIDRLIDAWLPLSLAVNSINRCMGQPDLYPFILSPSVIAKLGYIDRLIHGYDQETVDADFADSSEGAVARG